MAKYEVVNGVGIIPDGETIILNGAFRYCEDLVEVIIPASVTKIGREAFYCCENLTKVVIPGNVTDIESGAFANCTRLTSLVIPKSVTWISSEAFMGCENLNVIVVEEGNHKYDSRNNCNAIICGTTLVRGCCSTVIPDGIEVIGFWAFSGTKGLTNISIPNSVTKIENHAFYNTSLTSIVIPKSVMQIQEYGALSSHGLTSIVVEDGNPVYDSRDNCNAVIQKEKGLAPAVLVQGCCNTVIPDSVGKLGYGAFSGCENLTSITIPASVQVIGHYAFSCCKELKEIEIPETVLKIEQGAFSFAGLTSVTIPENVRDLDGVFTNCESLKSAIVKGKLEDYRSMNTFPFMNCPSLENITFLDCVRYIKEEYCTGCKSLKNIYVPAKKGDYYKKRFVEELHPLIFEMEPVKKSKKNA